MAKKPSLPSDWCHNMLTLFFKSSLKYSVMSTGFGNLLQNSFGLLGIISGKEICLPLTFKEKIIYQKL